ncbi:hypothetical protein GQX74_003063 [Glossina fuscipes]|nr:hypothetical protein GQX74_003063 [Glossina fuscipes]
MISSIKIEDATAAAVSNVKAVGPTEPTAEFSPGSGIFVSLLTTFIAVAAAAAATVFDAELITPPQLLLIALLRSVTKFPVGPRTTSVAAISLILLFSSCNQ